MRAQIGEALGASLRGGQLGLTLHHQGLHGGLLALALGQLAACRTHRISRLPGAGFSLSQLRLQRFSVHAHQQLTRAHQVPFAHFDRRDPARLTGGDIDLHRLDATVTAGDVLERVVFVVLTP